MTQENMDRLAKLRAERSEKAKQFFIEDLPLDRQERSILEACDHKYPDGQSAIEGGFVYVCKICRWSDL